MTLRVQLEDSKGGDSMAESKSKSVAKSACGHENLQGFRTIGQAVDGTLKAHPVEWLDWEEHSPRK